MLKFTQTMLKFAPTFKTHRSLFSSSQVKFLFSSTEANRHKRPINYRVFLMTSNNLTAQRERALEAYMKAAHLTLQQKTYDAIAAFDEAIKKINQNKDEDDFLKELLGVSMYTKGQLHFNVNEADALKPFQTAVELLKSTKNHQTQLSDSYYYIGDILISQGRWNESMENFQNAATIGQNVQNNEAIYRAYYGMAKNKTYQRKSEEAAEHLKVTLQYAVKALKDSDPMMSEIYQAMAHTNYDLGRYEDALEGYKGSLKTLKASGLNLAFATSDCHNKMAQVLFILKRNKEAIENVKQCLDIEGGVSDKLQYVQTEDLILVGSYLIEAQESDLAARVCKVVLEANKVNGQLSGSPYACNYLACIHKGKNNYDEAIRYAEEALATRKKMTSLHHTDGDLITWQLYETLAESYFHKKNIEKARIYYLKVIDEYLIMLTKAPQQPKSDKMWHYTQALGLTHLQLYMYGEALMWFTKSLEYLKENKIEDPLYAHHSYRQIGLVYQKLGQHEQALYYFETALKAIDGKLHPKDVHIQMIHFGISQTLEQLKRIDESLDLLIGYHKKLIDSEGKANEETEKIKNYIVTKCEAFEKSDKVKEL